MLACDAISAAVAPFLADGQRPNFIAGVPALYLLLTSWRAATRRAPSIGPMDYGGLASAVFVAAAGALFMHQGANHPSGTVDGSPSEAFVLFILVGVLAACGDLHLIHHLGLKNFTAFVAYVHVSFHRNWILFLWPATDIAGLVTRNSPSGHHRILPSGGDCHAAIVIWLVLVRVGKRGPAAS